MTVTLSLAGTYRKKLREYLHEDWDDTDHSLVCTLDDEYIRSIPLDTDILLTFKTLRGHIVQNIVRVDKLHRLGDSGKISAYYEFKVYGIDTLFGDTSIISSRKMPIIRTIRCIDILEYKILDVTEAPLFINWHWLAPSLKRKLFKV
jgi:hypothetical protein